MLVKSSNTKLFQLKFFGQTNKSLKFLLKNGYRQNYPFGSGLRCGEGHCIKTRVQQIKKFPQ